MDQFKSDSKGPVPKDEPAAPATTSGVHDDEAAFLDHLIVIGRLKRKDRERLAIFGQEGALPLMSAIAQLGLVPERELAGLAAEFLGLTLAAPGDYPIAPCLEQANIRYLKRQSILPLELTESALRLAVVNPFDRSIAQAFWLLTGRDVGVAVGVQSEIDAALQRLYGGGKTEVDDIITGLETEEALTDAEAQRLREMASEAPIVRLLNAVITRAVERGASDIHIESYETAVSLRYRIDGVLQDAESPPQQIGPALISRIKILARLNIAERRLPQDGRIKQAVLGKLIDFRVSIVPTLHGERIVLRILDHDHSPKTLQSLGMEEGTLGRLRKLLSRPNGVFLLTGPTGSGKTTTLYAALQALPVREKNIITVEDPIEYQIEGVNQIQTKPSIGLTFASVLRSILRQDPDIIMIGEIRDPETADIAVHSALTGHLVLSTLHTNSAAGAITRLLDMGVQNYLLASALEGVMAQRLVRRLCEACRVPVVLSETQAIAYGFGAAIPWPERIFRPGGCASCGGAGYRGRAVITDLLVMSEDLRTLVMRHASSQEIDRGRTDMRTAGLKADGLRLVAAGITSLEEIEAVVTGID